MTRISNFLPALRADDHDFHDMSGSPQDAMVELPGVERLQPLRFKFYDWDEVQRALADGAPSEAAAKSALTPHYFEFQLAYGVARIVLLEPGTGYEERASTTVSVHRGACEIECWDERSDSDDPNARLTVD
jgi:hypothetical protein